MQAVLTAINLVEKILDLGQAARDRYHEYREDHRPPSLLEAWRMDQEINKGNRELLRKLITVYENDGMAFDQ
jgi:hypothetical protein